jgi:hypothetical protein
MVRWGALEAFSAVGGRMVGGRRPMEENVDWRMDVTRPTDMTAGRV